MEEDPALVDVAVASFRKPETLIYTLLTLHKFSKELVSNVPAWPMLALRAWQGVLTERDTEWEKAEHLLAVDAERKTFVSRAL